ncbi:methylmalonyl-CoA epimerase [Salegentibacter sp. Hel_I_6]|uniref:methylmalonyl-CoA epimerase n=1 Tax=Salegentibacter sp. Hel_I_6 TaxID=1250278 RepID=UPI0006903793|nr:methylmalonyl-CoA epimerase [Salegentibacter sp. Hel_I_6]
MKKIEHIGIAVKDLEAANATYNAVLGSEHYKTESVESEGVSTSFFKIGESKIELLAATTSNSPIAKFIEKRGEGIHHIAFAVDDIKAEITRLQKEGFKLINTEPKDGADNKLVAFMHPKSANGVLVELCQEKSTSPVQSKGEGASS